MGLPLKKIVEIKEPQADMIVMVQGHQTWWINDIHAQEVKKKTAESCFTILQKK
jgi:hypothetical protein